MKASDAAQIRPRVGSARLNLAAPLADSASQAEAPCISAASLLAAESRVREAANENEIVQLIANEIRKLVNARQVIVFRARSPGEFRVVGISSIAVVDRDAAFVGWIERIADRIAVARAGKEVLQFELPAFTDADDADEPDYPFTHFMWQQLRLASGDPFAAVLVARETAWTDQECKVFEREANVFSGIWRALYADKALRPHRMFGRPSRIAICVTAFLGLLYPVPMSVLAPVEIIATQPQRVNAPLDGVIQNILVEPNRRVTAGQELLAFDRTTLSNKLELAEQEVLVAKARLGRVSQAAFVDEKARHEIALARAEFDLRRGERDYSADLLARSKVVAARSGILVYADKDRLIGRPVKTGERLMQIVDPEQVEARVELPIADAIVLEKAAGVRLFLDANPLSAIAGELVSAGFMAELNATQQLVYFVRVKLESSSERQRIGSRGIAQLQGSRVSLFFYLFRRPMSAVRQYLGL